MKVEYIFNKEIKSFFVEVPNSDATEVIRKIESTDPNYTSYYSLFDDFAFKLGIGFLAIPVENEKTGRLYGYYPAFNFYPDNIINEKPRCKTLVEPESPMTIRQVYSFLAKELLYRIMRVRNLDYIILRMQRNEFSKDQFLGSTDKVSQ